MTIANALFEVGKAHYFAPETLALGNEVGLDPFQFYFLGRGGVLGDVESSVVASAFGYFEPGLVKTMWDGGKKILSPRDAARLHLKAAHSYGRANYEGLVGLEEFCKASNNAIRAIDPGGLSLFSGYLGEPIPTDLPPRAQHFAVLLRELRGSVHLIAVVASGLTPRVAHFLRRPGDDALFGWSEPPSVSEADHKSLGAADALTEKMLEASYSVLRASAGFLSTLNEITSIVSAPPQG